MRVYRREAERLQRVKSLVESRFAPFGINKKREITRLLYEISKREDVFPEDVLGIIKTKRYPLLKGQLLRRRYPHATLEHDADRFYLPRLTLDPGSVFELSENGFSPKGIYVEETVSRSSLAERFRKVFSGASYAVISSFKDFKARRKRFQIEDYNRRSETIFIIDQRHDFFKRCPCTSGAVPCGYHIFNLAFGCIYECSYCYLQQYVNTPGIIFPANLDHFFERFTKYGRSPAARNWQKGPRLRIGTGEFSDSLMLDDITGYSLAIVQYFRRHPDVLFEFKTKSANVANLLRADHAGNIVAAWSLNPQKIIEANELMTASLQQRIEAAASCGEAGYPLAFHFDPVFYFSGWEEQYNNLVELLFSRIKPGQIAWISIGTFRFKPELKPIIEKRFPGNQILDEELILGYDQKLRYPPQIRFKIYERVIRMLGRHSPDLPIYLCMEAKEMWNRLKLPFAFR